MFGWHRPSPIHHAEILGMSPNAPEAEIFKEYAKKHESQNGTTQTAAAATGTCKNCAFAQCISFPACSSSGNDHDEKIT